MSRLTIFSIIFALLGEAILASIFFYFIPDYVLPTDLRVLDFVVVSLVYLLWINLLLRPMIDLKDESQRQVAGLGIRWISKIIYSIAAVGLVIISLIYGWEGNLTPDMFKWFLLGQIVLFFLFFFGMLSVLMSEKKAKEVYDQEKVLKGAKNAIKVYISDLVYAAEDSKGVPEEVLRRLRELSSETRFISPSSTFEAQHADDKIIETCKRLEPALRDYEMNKGLIEQWLEQLERDLDRRRKTL